METARLRALEKRIEVLERAVLAKPVPAPGKPVNLRAFNAALDAWVLRNDRRPYDDYCKHYSIP